MWEGYLPITYPCELAGKSDPRTCRAHQPEEGCTPPPELQQEKDISHYDMDRPCQPVIWTASVWSKDWQAENSHLPERLQIYLVPTVKTNYSNCYPPICLSWPAFHHLTFICLALSSGHQLFCPPGPVLHLYNPQSQFGLNLLLSSNLWPSAWSLQQGSLSYPHKDFLWIPNFLLWLWVRPLWNSLTLLQLPVTYINTYINRWQDPCVVPNVSHN